MSCSSDEWESCDEYTETSFGPAMAEYEPPAKTESIETVDIPYIDREAREKMTRGVDLVNVIRTKKSVCIYRCEPARTADGRKYPGIVIPEHMRTSPSLMISMYVHNAISEPVNVRVPDFKTKNVTFLRRGNSVFVEKPGNLVDHTLHFKKKSQDKSGNDVAFKLGNGFLSQTGNIMPVFTFVLVPFSNGQLDISSAYRTENFHVLSKRQSAYVPRATKRPKLNNEIRKLDTNVREAEVALNTVMVELQRVRHRNARFVAQTRSIHRLIGSLPDGPVRLALEYAMRNYEQDDDESGASL